MPDRKNSAAAATADPAATASTRERLLDAAIAVVRRDGLERLTTVSLTAEAGIAQPRLYRYFKGLDACLLEATERTAGGLMRVFSELRREMRDPTDLQELSLHYQAVFRTALEYRPLMELAMRYMHDPSALGQGIREANRTERLAFADDLYTRGRRAGLRARHRATVELLAHSILDATYGCITRLLFEPAPNPEQMAGELARFTLAGTRATFEDLLGRPVGGKPRRRS